MYRQRWIIHLGQLPLRVSAEGVPVRRAWDAARIKIDANIESRSLAASTSSAMSRAELIESLQCHRHGREPCFAVIHGLTDILGGIRAVVDFRHHCCGRAIRSEVEPPTRSVPRE